MNKIKKVLLLATSLVMATGLFTGCFMGGTNDNGNGNGTSVETIVGKSAYQIWLENGHEGSETDFLDWLRGETGEAGEDGEDGKSAYQIWLEAGNEGTEEDFLNWLKGEDCNHSGGNESSTQTPDSSVVEAKKYSFTVVTDKFAVDGTTTTEVEAGAELELPADPMAEGKTFAGWVDLEGNAVEAGATMPEEDYAIFATWEINAYTLTIKEEGKEDVTLKFGVEAVPATDEKPEIIDIDSLSFVLEGLYADTAEATYEIKDAPEEWTLADTTITVEASPVEYTLVIRDGNPMFGGYYEEKTVAFGEAIELPDPLEADGKNFLGWVMVDIETNETSEVPATMPAGNVFITADWEVIVYTLTINRVDGTVDTYKFGVEDVYAEDPADAVIGIGFSLDRVIEESKSVPTADCYDVEYVGIPENGIALEDTTISEQKVDKEGGEHDFSKLESDETGHWNACSGCGMKDEVVGHTSSFESNNNGTHNEVCGVCGYVLGSAVECNAVWSEEITEDGMKKKVCACGYADEAFIIDVTNEKIHEINLDLNEAGETTATFTLYDLLDEDIITFEKYGLISMYWGEVKIFDFMADDPGMNPEEMSASVFGTAYGLQTLSMGVMTGDDVQHVIDVQVLLVTSVIETKEELVAFNTLSKLCEEDANTYGGYFKLGANITLNNPVQIYKGGQTVWNAAFESIDTNGFVGTFDGCGYAIDGMIVNAKDMNAPAAFITEIGEGGVLKNVAFTNAVVSANRSVVTAFNCGTVENVYVHVFSFGGWIQKDSGMFTTFNEGWCGSSAAIINGGAWDAPGTVRNLFVDMTASAIVNTQDPTTNANYGKTWHDAPNVADTTVNALKLFGKPAGDAVYEGIYVVGIPANLAMLANNKTESDLFAGYVDFAAMKAAYDAENSALAAEIATWPTWLRGNAIVNVLDTVELSNRQSVNLDLQVANAAVTTSAAAAEIDISEIGENVGDLIAISYLGKAISGCSLEGAKVSVPVAAFGFDFGEKTMEVVTTTGKYSVPVLLVSKVIKTAADLDAMNYIAKACGSVSGEWNGYFQLGNNIQYNGNWVPMNDFSMGRVLPMDFVDDLTADADGYAMYNGRYLISGNKLVLLSALQVEGAVVDTGSKNWAQAGWGTGNSVKYNNTWLYVSNSVDKDTLNWAARGEGFIGTFDGCGYAIDGVKVGVDMSYSGFFGQVGNGALIKNVAFTNAEYHAMSMGGFLACFAKSGSVVENVYIQLTHTITGAGSAISATDNFRSQDGLTLRNVFVDASTITVTSSQYSVLGGSTEADKDKDGVADTYTVYQGAYAIVNNETQKTNAYGKGGIHANSTNHGVYVGAEAMKNDAAAQAEIATWDTTYWTIVEGIPTWNK